MHAIRKVGLTLALLACAVLTVGTGVCNVWAGASLLRELLQEPAARLDGGTVLILLMALGLTAVFGWLSWRLARALWPRRAPPDRGTP